jgi:hypothetical protein
MGRDQGMGAAQQVSTEPLAVVRDAVGLKLTEVGSRRSGAGSVSRLRRATSARCP